MTTYFNTNTSFFGFPNMVQKGGSFDPYDPPLDSPLDRLYIIGWSLFLSIILSVIGKFMSAAAKHITGKK